MIFFQNTFLHHLFLLENLSIVNCCFRDAIWFCNSIGFGEDIKLRYVLLRSIFFYINTMKASDARKEKKAAEGYVIEKIINDNMKTSINVSFIWSV